MLELLLGLTVFITLSIRSGESLHCARKWRVRFASSALLESVAAAA